MEVRVEKVEVILNSALTERFSIAEEMLHNSKRGADELRDRKQSDTQRRFLKNLLIRLE